MPPPARIVRRLDSIRTRSGAPDQTLVPYRAYMAITALEMEKSRRQIERQGLLTRLQTVTARLQSIDTEKAVLLDRLSKLAASPADARPVSTQPATRSRAAGFKHRY